MAVIDLNCDLGESFGTYRLGLDEEVITYVTSANVACGYHAADPLVMQKTVALAKENGVHIGAHTGYPDLMGFGRRNMDISCEEAKAYVQYQTGALSAFCKAAEVPLYHVKAHGAMYNRAGKDYKFARAICEGIYEIDPHLAILALSGSEMVNAAKAVGIRGVLEVFADRAYEEDGSLVARTKEGAILTEEGEIIVRAIRMVREGRVKAITGKDIPIQADSICVHGDGEKALAFVKRIRTSFEREQIQVTAF